MKIRIQKHSKKNWWVFCGRINGRGNKNEPNGRTTTRMLCNNISWYSGRMQKKLEVVLSIYLTETGCMPEGVYFRLVRTSRSIRKAQEPKVSQERCGINARRGPRFIIEISGIAKAWCNGRACGCRPRFGGAVHVSAIVSAGGFLAGGHAGNGRSACARWENYSVSLRYSRL